MCKRKLNDTVSEMLSRNEAEKIEIKLGHLDVTNLSKGTFQNTQTIEPSAFVIKERRREHCFQTANFYNCMPEDGSMGVAIGKIFVRCTVQRAPLDSSGFCGGKAPVKGHSGGRKGNREALAFSIQCRVGTLKTGRDIAEAAKMPTVDVVLRARDLRWNRLGQTLTMDERRLVLQALLKCIKPTPESIIGDVVYSDIQAVIDLARDRIEWKNNRPLKGS